MKNQGMTGFMGAKKFGYIMGMFSLAWASSVQAQTTGFNKAAAGPFDYATTANWVGGNVNGTWDSSLTLTSGQAVTFSSDLVMATGLNVGYTGNVALTFRGDGTNRTITLGGDITVAPVSDQTVTFGSGTSGQFLNVNLGGTSRTFTVGTNKTLAFTNVVSNGSIIKAGGGTLTLTGTNTYAGGLTLNAGTLNINNASALGTGTFTIAGGTINTNAGITLSGNNAQAWNGDFTFTGSNTLNLGTGAVSLGSSRQVTVSASTLTVGGVISGSGFGLTKAGAGTLTLNAANTYDGGTVVNEGILAVGSAGRLGANTVGNNVSTNGGIITMAAAANIGANQTLTLGSSVTSLGGVGVAFNALPAFTQSGSDPVLVAINLSNYTAITNQSLVGSGNIFMGSTGTGSFSGGSLGAGTGSTYRLGGGGGTFTVTTAALAGANNVVIGTAIANGGGTVVLSGTNTYTGTTTINNGTLRATDGVGLAGGNLLITNGIYEPGADFTRGLGTGSGQVRLVATGTNSSTGFGANGTTRVIALGGTGSPTALTWGSADFSPSTGTGAFHVNGSSGTVDFRNAIDLNNTGSAVNRTINGVGTVIMNGNLTQSGAGAASLTKTGGGELVLNGNNTFTGGLTWGGGTTYTLTLGSDTALGTGTFSATTTAAVTIRSLTDRVLANSMTTTAGNLYLGEVGTYSGLISIGDVTHTANNQGVTVNLSQATLKSYTSLGGSVSKGGTGTLFITNDWTITSGRMQLTTGVLAVGGVYSSAVSLELDGGVIGMNGTRNEALGASTNGIKFNSTKDGGFFAYGKNATWGNSANNLTINFGGAAAVQTWGVTGSFVGAGQTLLLGNALSNGTIELKNGINFNGVTRTVQTSRGTTNTAGGADAILSGILSNGGLAKTGNGVLSLTGNNTYSGGTTVSNGVLLVNNVAGSGTGSGTVTVSTGATLGGNGTIAGAVTVDAGATLAPGNSPGKLTLSSNLTLASGSFTNLEISGTTRGTTFDAVDVGGVTTFGGSLTFALSGTYIGGEVLDLFGITGTSLGDFSSLTSTGSYAGTWGKTGEIWSLSSGGLDLNFSEATGDLSFTAAVPEPSTYALVAGGMAFLFFIRRKRSVV